MGEADSGIIGVCGKFSSTVGTAGMPFGSVYHSSGEFSLTGSAFPNPIPGRTSQNGLGRTAVLFAPLPAQFRKADR